MRHHPCFLLPLLLLLLPHPVRAGSDGELSLAADAAVYLRLRPSFLQQQGKRPGLLGLLEHKDLGQVLEALKLPPLGQLAGELGLDPARDIVASLGLVEEKALRRVLGSPQPPGRGKPLPSVRFALSLPYADERTMLRGLERHLSRQGATWTPARGDPRRLKAFLALQASEADRRAARQITAGHLVRWGNLDAVIRLHREGRTLEIQAALSGLAAAAAPLSPAPAGQRQSLAAAGFLEGSFALYLEPQAWALMGQAVSLIQVAAALSGVEAKVRQPLWRAATAEIGTLDTLAQARPILFRSLVLGEASATWRLTAAGAQLLAGLPFPARLNRVSLARLARAVARRLPSTSPPFSTRAEPLQLVRSGGFFAYPIAGLFLWPHLLSWAATHEPRLLEEPWSKAIAVPGIRVDLDRTKQRLTIRAQANRRGGK